jgi:hypothetical protein
LLLIFYERIDLLNNKLNLLCFLILSFLLPVVMLKHLVISTLAMNSSQFSLVSVFNLTTNELFTNELFGFYLIALPILVWSCAVFDIICHLINVLLLLKIKRILRYSFIHFVGSWFLISGTICNNLMIMAMNT